MTAKQFIFNSMLFVVVNEDDWQIQLHSPLINVDDDERNKPGSLNPAKIV